MTGAVPPPRLALPSRRGLVQIPAGGPRASPTQTPNRYVFFVGEGLAPPAGFPKSAVGAAFGRPLRRLQDRRARRPRRAAYICGPVWDRPLRRPPDRFPYFCRGGTPGRPFPGRPVSGPYGIPDTSPFFVGAGPRPAPAQKSGPAWGRFPHIYWGMSMRTPHTRI